MKRVLLLFTLVCCVVGSRVHAQTTTISGTVTDSEDGTPIPGATVFEQGVLTNGVITGIDGNFTVKLSKPDAKIVVQFVGYEDQIITPNGRSIINISLKVNVEELQEVVMMRQKKNRFKQQEHRSFIDWFISVPAKITRSGHQTELKMYEYHFYKADWEEFDRLIEAA